MWVEIDNKSDKNFLICCAYRHPNSNIDNLTSHFQNHLSKLSSDKILFILGDFNVNLSDFASHTPTSGFVNNFFLHTAFFLAFIIQLELLNTELQSLITSILMLPMLI